jgi:hypothetical protein
MFRVTLSSNIESVPLVPGNSEIKGLIRHE